MKNLVKAILLISIFLIASFILALLLAKGQESEERGTAEVKVISPFELFLFNLRKFFKLQTIYPSNPQPGSYATWEGGLTFSCSNLPSNCCTYTKSPTTCSDRWGLICQWIEPNGNKHTISAGTQYFTCDTSLLLRCQYYIPSSAPTGTWTLKVWIEAPQSTYPYCSYYITTETFNVGGGATTTTTTRPTTTTQPSCQLYTFKCENNKIYYCDTSGWKLIEDCGSDRICEITSPDNRGARCAPKSNCYYSIKELAAQSPIYEGQDFYVYAKVEGYCPSKPSNARGIFLRLYDPLSGKCVRFGRSAVNDCSVDEYIDWFPASKEEKIFMVPFSSIQKTGERNLEVKVVMDLAFAFDETKDTKYVKINVLPGESKITCWIPNQPGTEIQVDCCPEGYSIKGPIFDINACCENVKNACGILGGRYCCRAPPTTTTTTTPTPTRRCCIVDGEVCDFFSGYTVLGKTKAREYGMNCPYECVNWHCIVPSPYPPTTTTLPPIPTTTLPTTTTLPSPEPIPPEPTPIWAILLIGAGIIIVVGGLIFLRRK